MCHTHECSVHIAFVVQCMGMVPTVRYQGKVAERQEAVRASDETDEGNHAVVVPCEVLRNYAHPHFYKRYLN